MTLFYYKFLTVSIFCFIVSLGSLSAQVISVADSLEKRLPLVTGKERVDVLKELCWANRNYRPEIALQYGHEALLMAEKLKLPSELASIHNYIGVIRRNQGNYSKSLQHYFAALHIADSISNKRELAYAMNNLGDIFNRQKKYAKAEEYISKALELFKQIGIEKGVAYCYNQLSLVNFEQNNLEKALFYNFKSLEMREKNKDSVSIAASLNNIGNIYIELQDFDVAFKYLNRSLHIRHKIGDYNGIAEIYNDFARFYFQKRDYQTAVYYLNQGMKIGKEVGSPRRIREAAELLSRIYAQKKEYEKAYHYHVIFKKMNDSLRNKENEREITRLELQYKFDKERRENEVEQLKKDIEHKAEINHYKMYRFYMISCIIVLIVIIALITYSYRQKRKDNHLLALKNKEIIQQKEEIQDKRDELERINASKDKFFSIVAHDLRSPFSSLLSLIDLMKNQFNDLDKNEVMLLIDEINKSAKETMNLLENLLNWARSQTNRLKIKMEKADIQSIVEKNIILFKNVAKNKHISLQNPNSGTLYAFADTNMLDTVLRNLISNAIKFTPQNGQVIVDYYERNEKIFIEVKDTGIGMKQSELDNLFRIDTTHSRIGTANERGTGLGLLLCKEFVEKNHGTIHVESTEGEGSKFVFSLQKYYPTAA